MEDLFWLIIRIISLHSYQITMPLFFIISLLFYLNNKTKVGAFALTGGILVLTSHISHFLISSVTIKSIGTPTGEHNFLLVFIYTYASNIGQLILLSAIVFYFYQQFTYNKKINKDT